MKWENVSLSVWLNGKCATFYVDIQSMLMVNVVNLSKFSLLMSRNVHLWIADRNGNHLKSRFLGWIPQTQNVKLLYLACLLVQKAVARLGDYLWLLSYVSCLLIKVTQRYHFFFTCSFIITFKLQAEIVCRSSLTPTTSLSQITNDSAGDRRTDCTAISWSI